MHNTYSLDKYTCYAIHMYILILCVQVEEVQRKKLEEEERKRQEEERKRREREEKRRREEEVMTTCNNWGKPES